MEMKPKAVYEIRVIWQHDDIEVQHHVEPGDARFEVRKGGGIKYIFAATRAWQAERRVAIEIAAELAGVPRTATAPTPAGPRPQKQVPQERITPLVYALAEVLYEENPARSLPTCQASARDTVYAAIAQGYNAFTDLEAEVQRNVNSLRFAFEADAREKVVVYGR